MLVTQLQNCSQLFEARDWAPERIVCAISKVQYIPGMTQAVSPTLIIVKLMSANNESINTKLVRYNLRYSNRKTFHLL